MADGSSQAQGVLQLAHEHSQSGHFEVKKT